MGTASTLLKALIGVTVALFPKAEVCAQGILLTETTAFLVVWDTVDSFVITITPVLVVNDLTFYSMSTVVIFQEVFQPVDLFGVLLDFLPALQKVVAGHGLVGVTFAFFASKHGRDQVDPLAVFLSIPILFVTLTPGTPLAPFAVDGYEGVERKLVFIILSLKVIKHNSE